MRLCCVLVCSNYADFLEKSLPLNRKHFDEFVVVTTEGDKRTQELCKTHDVKVVFTTRIGPGFNRGAALQDGLDAISWSSWILVTDADIVLPENFRKDVEGLDPEILWGASRRFIRTGDQWEEFVKTGPNPNWQIEWGLATGYFQLYHTNAKGVQGRKYPDWFEGSAGADNTFKAYFKEWKCLALVVLHLGVHGSGENWMGRTEKPWP